MSPPTLTDARVSFLEGLELAGRSPATLAPRFSKAGKRVLAVLEGL